MKVLLFSIIFLGMSLPVHSSDTQLEEYISSFDYARELVYKLNSL